MQSFCGRIRSLTKNAIKSPVLSIRHRTRSYGSIRELPVSCKSTSVPSIASSYRDSRLGLFWGAHLVPRLTNRGITTVDGSQDATASTEVAPCIKFKRLDKTARHILQILDKEAVQEVSTQREISEIMPGYIIQLKLEVPENKRRVSTAKGIVIARRNAGLNTTIRLRRLVAGVGVENLLPLVLKSEGKFLTQFSRL